MFRVCNMRKSHLIESHLRAQVLHHRKKSPEGEILAYECEELKITTQHSFEARLFISLIAPLFEF